MRQRRPLLRQRITRLVEHAVALVAHPMLGYGATSRLVTACTMTPFPYDRINIVGAAGSGTSTLGGALARRLGYAFLDADDFYWRPTTPPFQQKYEAEARLATIVDAMDAQPATVIAGSVAGWGEQLEDAFDLVVFLSLPTALRMQRIEAREIARFGRADPAFLAWAEQYEEGRLSGRSRARHEAWLSSRTCRVLRIEGDQDVDARVDALIHLLGDERVGARAPGRI